MPWPDLLPEGDIHLHLIDDTTVTDAGLLEAYAALLTPDEAERRDRFHFGRHRHQFLVARALIRTTLSHYCPDISPGSWRFELNDHGRPRIAEEIQAELDFNVTHTDGRIVLAVCRQASPGVDIERADRPEAILDIAAQFFAEEEVRGLVSLPEPARRQRFFRLWTLKEAYIKAKGKGLSIPLKDFAISFPPHGLPEIRFAAGVDDDPRRWQFWSISAGKDYALALALADTGRKRLRLFRTIPMLSSQEIECRLLA